jgi:hypothetical protein
MPVTQDCCALSCRPPQLFGERRAHGWRRRRNSVEAEQTKVRHDTIVGGINENAM